MSQGLRTRMINADAAEGERKARLARMADRLDPDEDVLRAVREEDAEGARMVAAAVVVAVFVAGVAFVLWAMPDIVSWMVGQPAIVVRVAP
jgi:uncharacterized membrane protein